MVGIDIQTYRQRLEQAKGRQQGLLADQAIKKGMLDLLNEKLLNAAKALAIIQEVGTATQRKLEAHVSNIVSMALAAVFDDPYEFLVEFVPRRGKTECDLWFVRNKEKVCPIDASGGGAVDIAALALRFALWALSKDKYRNTMILDEPCRNLSRDLHSRASAMITMISKKLNLQIIMVTHSPELVECSDTIFNVKLSGGISTVS